ncbi:MAG: hypothetical protein J1G01_07030 [Clostridiales bacterium]|nr:hypothetical protein [Clostridiales bacterium]
MRKSKLIITLIVSLWICFMATGLTLIIHLSTDDDNPRPDNPDVDPPSRTVIVASEDELIAALGEDDATIKLADDIEITGNGGTLQHSGNSTIELDGHNLTGSIENSGSLTISNTSNEDSVISANGDAAIVNSGDCEIKGGVSVSGSIRNENNGTLAISGASDGKTDIYSDSGHSVYNEGNLEIDGDVTVYCNRSIKASAIYNAEGGTAAIRGGTFLYKEDTELTDSAWYVIFNALDATITELKNVTVKGDTHASLVENFGLIQNIANVHLENSVNVIKNEPAGVIDKISGGTFTMKTGYENNAKGNASVILNGGKIKEIVGGEFVIADTAYPVTTDAGRLAVITNNGTIDNISGGTFRSETTEKHDIVYNAGSISISGGDFTAEDGIAYVVYNGNKLNISGGAFLSEASTEHHVIYTHAVSIDSEIVYGTTNISGGTFAIKDAAGDSKVVWSSTGLTSKAQTQISGGTFFGDMNMGTVGPTTPIKYNIVISGGLFDREIWSSVVGGAWTIRGVEPDRAVIYGGKLYRIIEDTALTYTDKSSDGYFEAMIPSSDTARNLDMYYASSRFAMQSVFDLTDKGYEVLVKLYVSDSTDIVLPLGKKLSIEFAVAGVKYTGTVHPADGSTSTTFGDRGETDNIIVYDYNISRADAKASIFRYMQEIEGEQEIYRADLEDAFAAAKDGDRIVVLEDHSLTKSIEVNVSNIILDLNGKTVSYSSIILWFKSANAVENFILRDSSANADGVGTGKLTTSGSDPIRIAGSVSMTIESGTFESTKSKNPYSIYKSTSSPVEVVITGGIFKNGIYGASTWLNIQGGTFASDPAKFVGGRSSNNAVLRKDNLFYVVTKADLNYDTPSSAAYYEAKIPTNQPDAYADYYYASADAAINDVFSLGTGYDTLRAVIELYVSSSAPVTLSAYTSLTIYYKADEVQYSGNVSVPAGYSTPTPTPVDGGVSYEAMLPQTEASVEISHNGTIRYYLNLTDAFKFAQDGDKITIRESNTEATKLTASATLKANNVTLDLNGKTVYGASQTLTIEGVQNLKIEDSKGGGQVITTGTISTSATPLLLKGNATVTITGGTFTRNDISKTKFCLHFSGFTGSLTINGGTFVGEFNYPNQETLFIHGGSFTTDPTAYVAANSTVTGPNEEGYYTVTSKT